MGIPLFFKFWRDNFRTQTKSVKRNVSLPDLEVYVDNLLLDLNGPIHTAAQKAYKYGSYARPPRLLGDRVAPKISHHKTHIIIFEDICAQIVKLLTVVQPRKRLIICIDGPAPLAKQNQQRKRRYKSAMEASDDCAFDSNCITPGTEFMDKLSTYIDRFIRKSVTSDPQWKKLEVVFSSDRAHGEGEHKALNYIRFYGDSEESFCINGCDADLIMLALGTHLPEMYILREDPYDDQNEYFCLDIGRSHDKLASIVQWESDQHEFIPSWAVNDFIFLCFMVGNDFLPHIPSIEIIEDGVDVIIEVYREVCSSYGHITRTSPESVDIQNKPLGIFMATIGHYEKELLDKKLTRKASYFPDPLLEKCADPIVTHRTHEPSLSVDITMYRKKFCEMAFPSGVDLEEVSHQYLEGMQWVLSYYLRGVPSWKWMYPYHYAPPAHILAQHIDTFVPPTYPRTVPSTPFQQLLCVLPPKSAPLIPNPLSNLICDRSSPLKAYCPDEFKIDLSGKRKEWEGIVLLPIVDYDVVCSSSDELLDQVDPKDLIRNSARQTCVYTYDTKDAYCFVSKYGNIKKCKVRTQCIDI